MADSQDVLSADPYGYDPGGEVTTAWGGHMSKPGNYTGGYTYDSPDAVGVPKDWAAWRAAQATSVGTSGRAQDVTRYRGMADAAMGRAAPTLDYGQADISMRNASGSRALANAQMWNGAEDRGRQLDAARQLESAAMGNEPSQAQLLGRNMIDQSLQAQMAGAAGARGGGMAQAAAMRNASQGAAGMQAQGMNQLSALRADEMAKARDAWMTGVTGMRGQDYQGAAQGTALASQATDMAKTSAQMEQYRALNENQQRSLNQNQQQHFEDLGFNVNQAALNAGMGRTGQMQQQNQFEASQDMQQQQNQQQMYAAAIGGMASMGSAAIARRAEGGPVAPGQPTLVGEQGPEVIMPTSSAMVLPATHPASRAAQKTMSMGDVAKLRQQADEIERGLRANMARGASVHHAQPVAMGYAPEPQRERLYGGREDPYTADPYFVPTDRMQPTTIAPLATRDDPYAPGMANAAIRRTG